MPKKNTELFKRWMFAESTHDAESYTLRALLSEQGFEFVPYCKEIV